MRVFGGGRWESVDVEDDASTWVVVVLEGLEEEVWPFLLIAVI